ncbi:hypothetical protein EON81_26025, partial [bacterium]
MPELFEETRRARTMMLLSELRSLVGVAAILLVPMAAAGEPNDEEAIVVAEDDDVAWATRTMGRLLDYGRENACALCGCTNFDACIKG